MDKAMNMQKPDISIILPVYNVEKQLVKCLNSIISQKFSGTFEIIACEASSSDSSLAQLKAFQLTEPRLKIIEHGVREKLSTSRATGMNAATGQYIMHVDSDDWLLPDAFENLYRACLETDADVVVFDYIKENNEGKRSRENRIKKKLITTDKLKVQHHFYGAVWKKIVKRELTENMIYGEIATNFTEDLIYSSEILLRAEKICLLPESYYVYYENINSLTWQIKSEEYIKNQTITIDQIQKITTKYNADKKFINNVMNKIEKFIYLEFAKIHFLGNDDLSSSATFVNKCTLYPIMTSLRIFRLTLSIKNKYINLLEVTKYFGLRVTLGIIWRSFKK